MPTIERFEDLEVWQEAREAVLAIYRVTKEFPSNERHGLANQMQRAAISTMSGIVEGFERETSEEFINFLYAALGSAGRVRSQAYTAIDLWYISRRPSATIWCNAVASYPVACATLSSA